MMKCGHIVDILWNSSDKLSENVRWHLWEKKGINNDIMLFFWESRKLVSPFDDMKKTGVKRLVGCCFVVYSEDTCQ